MTLGVAGLMVFGTMAVPQIRGQSQDAAAAPPAFEAASIKLNTSGGPGAEMYPSKSEVRIKNYSLKQLIQAAYKVKDYSFAGPPWLDSQRFDIVAKLPQNAKADQFPAMLQTLLRERFQLIVHRESRIMTALALVVDKGGLKIKPVEAGQGGSGWGSTMIRASKVSMTQLAELLSSAMDRPVQDLTELTGVYDIDLKWMPDDAPSMDAAGGGDRQSPTCSPPATSVFSAVQELGLELQTRKLPVEVLVVDHAEKPSEN